MENLNHLSMTELVSYLDRTSTDPAVLRLVETIQAATVLFKQVNDCIDDNNLRIELDEIQWYDEDLVYLLGRKEHYLNDELRILEDEVIELRREVKKNEARTVAELISELHHSLNRMGTDVRNAQTAEDAARKDREVMHSKLKMWSSIAANPTNYVQL